MTQVEFSTLGQKLFPFLYKRNKIRGKVKKSLNCTKIISSSPAEFESPIPRLTWNSELCFSFNEIFGSPSYLILPAENAVNALHKSEKKDLIQNH